MTYGGRCRIVFRRHELHVVKFQAQVVNRFLDQVRILVTGVAELRRGHTYEQDSAAGVTVTCRFQPCVIGVPVDLFF